MLDGGSQPTQGSPPPLNGLPRASRHPLHPPHDPPMQPTHQQSVTPPLFPPGFTGSNNPTPRRTKRSYSRERTTIKTMAARSRAPK
jgi:hypothetical protein